MNITSFFANPWSRLPDSAPLVLKDDLNAVEVFNRTAKPHHEIDVKLLPEPFLGQFNAPVVLLNLNPGWSPGDAEWHADPEFARLSRANLSHSKSDFPFYLLNPRIQASPGGAWWRMHLRSLIEDIGSVKRVANRVLCVEYFPYHSANFDHKVPELASQEFGFGLVRSAIERHAVIVGLRSIAFWLSAVPELARYDRWFTLRNVQRVWVSRGNLPDGYDKVVSAIKSD
jgi:hypothetical protein